ncbi:hypothetical protein TNCV_3489281 [Trichonephila clavipes]|nr:hypothetical protein TNCV_3489281 [Trichonephila clavipes]
MVLKANDRRTSSPCHDEFRGPRSDCVRQVASENNNNNKEFLKTLEPFTEICAPEVPGFCRPTYHKQTIL